MTADNLILAVTTDEFPGQQGQAVVRAGVAWRYGSTMGEALDRLTRYARESGYHAVVGLRFMLLPSIRSEHMGLAPFFLPGAHVPVETELWYYAYGTAVQYADAPPWWNQTSQQLDLTAAAGQLSGDVDSDRWIGRSPVSADLRAESL